jgi:hypothetical protein
MARGLSKICKHSTTNIQQQNEAQLVESEVVVVNVRSNFKILITRKTIGSHGDRFV